MPGSVMKIFKSPGKRKRTNKGEGEGVDAETEDHPEECGTTKSFTEGMIG